ncbi:MAG: pyridoxine 5'-phosphate synthase [Proteobacteria bacterium]|nr:pyridoxine 5'-phosphate synthase [Pseudomonadota bacterium]
MPGGEVAYRGHFFLLFVNIDHIATLREARRGNESDPAEYAVMCEKGGCDGIMVSLRKDRRYMQDGDIFAIKDVIRGKLNLEVALSGEMFDIALKIKPNKIIVIPENREEITAEVVLDVKTNMLKIKDTVKLFHDQNILVSLLVEPDIEIVELSKECGADFIEIHTGKYCNTIDKTDIDKEIDRIYTAADHAVKVGIKVGAGHGLTYKNIMPVLYARALEEVNIGHSIILRSLSVGLSKAVEEMIDILD